MKKIIFAICWIITMINGILVFFTISAWMFYLIGAIINFIFPNIFIIGELYPAGITTTLITYWAILSAIALILGYILNED
jgi:hypothetical protein